MAETKHETTPTKEAGVSSLRIDAPHAVSTVVETAPAADPALLASAAGDASGAQGEAILSQAQQLAVALRERQRQLDLAETELNSKLARFDHEQRTARLWMREKEIELTEKLNNAERAGTELQARLAGVSSTHTAGEAELAARQTALEHSEREVKRQTEQLERRRENLDERASELDTLQHQVLLEQERIVEQCQREERRIAAEREAGQRAFREAESLLAGHLSQLERDRKSLEEERLLLHEEMRGERLALAHRQQELENQYREKQADLGRHAETMEQRRSVLEELHTEVTRLHRESLEMRLITEQLWQQLCRHAAPADLTRGVANLRGQLAEHYQATQNQTTEARNELVALATALDGRQKQLRQQRRELDDWIRQRNHEIEEQAARLVAREQELEQQDASHRTAAALWQRERQQLQNQIRRLSVQVTHSAAAA